MVVASPVALAGRKQKRGRRNGGRRCGWRIAAAARWHHHYYTYYDTTTRVTSLSGVTSAGATPKFEAEAIFVLWSPAAWKAWGETEGEGKNYN